MSRPTLMIPGWLIVLACFFVALFSVLWVVGRLMPGPSTGERVVMCPKYEAQVEHWEEVEAARPLRAYEVRQQEEVREWLDKWCQ